MYELFIGPFQKGLHTYIADHIDPGQTIVDAGCGTGSLVFRMAPEAKEVLGVDLSPGMIRHAERRLEREGIEKVSFLLGDVSQVLAHHPAHRFDLATLVLSLHEMDQASRVPVLHELARVARTVLCVDFRVPMPWNLAGVRNRFFEVVAGVEHFAAFREFNALGGTGGICEAAQLQCEHVRYIDKGTLEIHEVRGGTTDSTELFEDFDFRGIELALPTRVFEGKLELTVGDKRIDPIEVGPAHTRGDVLVHVPGDRTVFTGDILFADAHPLVWEGPVANWIAACDLVLSLDVETVVPGHGPVTDLGGIRRQKHYLEYVSTEARRCYEAGLSVEDAARDISLDAFEGWLDAERIYVNVHTLYRDFAGNRQRPDVLEMFAGMTRLRRSTLVAARPDDCAGPRSHGKR